MLTPILQTRPLEFDVSISDFFHSFLCHGSSGRKIKYDYRKITIDEAIGAEWSSKDLIYYPHLCKSLRQLRQLHYQTSVDLAAIPNYEQKGLLAMLDCLKAIDEALSSARTEKARLDADVNNLIYLYGQTRELPIFQEVKPYCTRGHRANAYRLTISGVPYWLNYRNKRFAPLTPLYAIDEHSLLNSYFKANQNNPDTIKPVCRFQFLGGVLNTPIYAFRVRQSYNHKGQKHYIDLADNTSYSRIADVRDKAKIYTKKFELKLIKDQP